MIYLLLAAAFAWAVYSYRDQLAETALVLRQGVWYLVLAALLLLGGALYNHSALYANLYKLFGLPPQKRQLLPLYLITKFVIVAAPSGGISGWIPFIQDARKRGLGVGTVMIVNLIFMILWHTAFSVFLFLGFFNLFIAHDLAWFEISAAFALLGVDAVMIGALLLASFRPALLRWLAHGVKRAVAVLAGGLRRASPVSPDAVDNFVGDLVDAASTMREQGWQRMLRPYGHALLNETINLAILYLLGLAFGLQLSLGVLVAAYSVSILFYIISPTPGGLGFVEGAMVLALTSLGVARPEATVLTLAYRGITFWLPFTFGFVALRWQARQPVAH